MWALFKGTDATLTGIPQSYKDYHIIFGLKVKLPTADIDTILRWRTATNIRIVDQNNVAYHLIERIDDMSNMNVLEQLSLNLNSDSYKKINVRDFVERLSKLGHIQFTGDSLSEEEIMDFVGRQDLPAGWKTEIFSTMVVYTKNTLTS